MQSLQLRPHHVLVVVVALAVVHQFYATNRYRFSVLPPTLTERNVRSPAAFNDSNIIANFSNRVVSFNAATSVSIVDDRHEYVMKVLKNINATFDTLDREVCILKQLALFSWAPRLAWYNSSSMKTSYASEPLDLFNIPLDYREQYAKILVDMKSVGVQHGNIHKSCAQDGVPLSMSQRLESAGKGCQVV